MQSALSFFIGVIISVSTCSAQGAVLAFLRSTEPIIFLIQGNDSDAGGLFLALDVPAVQISSSTLEKELRSPSGQILISCRHSALISSGTCTITLKHGPNLEFSKEKKSVNLQSSFNDDAEFLFENLTKGPDGTVPMFTSERQDFTFSSKKDYFNLSYQSIAP